MSDLRMPDMNNCEFAGRLTRDPEKKHIGDNVLCKASMAVPKRIRKKDGEYEEKTTYIDMNIWGNTATYVVDHMKKGHAVMVQGYMESNNWEKDGKKFSKLELTVNRIQALSWEDREANKEPETSDSSDGEVSY